MSAPTLLCLQLGLYAVLGLIASRLLEHDRAPMWHWAAYAGLSALAMAGLAWRPDGPLWLTGPGVGAASLLSLLVATRGAVLFLGLPSRDREHLAVLMVAAIGLGLIGPDPAHAHGRIALTSGLSAWTLARAVQICWRAVWAEYGRRLTLAASAPVLSMCVLNAALAVQGLMRSAVRADVAEVPPASTWVVILVSAAAFNFLFLFLLVRRLNQRLRHQARHDPLTDLLNRRAMTHVLEAEWQRWQRMGQPFTLITLDVDHFKRINDEHGHEAGDRVLCALADRLRTGLRVVDRVARMGGEEFLLMLPGCACQTDGLAKAERQRAALAAFPVDCGHGLRLTVTASWGVGGPLPGDSAVDALLRRVDAAVYEAKRQGRDRVVAQAASAAA